MGWGAKKKSIPVIVFDAFENDYLDDPFVSISAKIYSYSRNADIREEKKDSFLKQASQVGARIAPSLATAVVKAATAGLLDIDAIKDNPIINTALDELGGTNANYIGASVKAKMLSLHEAKSDFEKFRETLEELSKALSIEKSDSDNNVPLVFLIDELDRCRPNFAISLLEVIKHFYSVNNVKFVVVTNLAHLTNSVKGIYGMDVDGKLYLEKFYQVVFHLPDFIETTGSIRIIKYIEYLWEVLEIDFYDKRADYLLKKELCEIAKFQNLSLRNLERIVSNVALTYASVPNGHYFIGPIVAGLCAIKHSQPKLYERLKNIGDGDAELLDEVLKFVGTGEKIRENVEWTIELWKIHLLPRDQIDPKVLSKYQSNHFRHNIPRNDVIHYLIKMIESVKFV